MATSGGIQAYHAACGQREMVHVHQILRGPVGPQRIAHHAERIGSDESPQTPVAQQFGVRRSRDGFRQPARSWRAVQFQTGIHSEPENARQHERHAPSVAHRDPGGDGRRENRAQAHAGLIDGVAHRAFGRPQIRVDRLAGRRNAAGFRHAQHRAAAHQAAEAAGEAGGDSGARPQPQPRG